MDNKQNQPNSGATSPSSATNKPASATVPAYGADNEPFGAPTNPGQQPASASKAAKTPQATTDKAASTAESSQFGQPQDTQRKSWMNQEELLKGVNQLPQSLKELGTKAAEQISSLSTTQKVVGGALLVSGLSWLALRGKKTKSSASDPYKPYKPKDESKWKSSSESVYRGASSGLHDSGTENGF